jgi:pSer/pThr/pTyr-binding forkhead associated (FHA) protein
MFKLVIQDDEGKTTVVPLIRDEITVGRKEGNTIRLTERNVSRHHARIVRGNGSIAIEDLDSYNGIRVNGSRIKGRQPLTLSDRIQIGDYLIELKADNGESPPPTPDDQLTQPIEKPERAASSSTSIPALQLGGPHAETIKLPAQLVSTSPSASHAKGDNGSGGGHGGGNGVSAAAAMTPAPVFEAPPPAPAPAVEADDEAPARLIVLSSNFAGHEYELAEPTMVLGRTDDNDVVINHRSISRNHAKVVQEDGRYTIVDLQSSNGVRVNNEEYDKVELRRGDIIDLGHVRLRFADPGDDYTFKPEDVSDVATGSSKGVWYALLAVLVVLVGVGVFALLNDGTPTGNGDNGAPEGQGGSGQTNPSAPAPKNDFDGLMGQAEAALAARDWALAEAKGREALGMVPADQAAQQRAQQVIDRAAGEKGFQERLAALREAAAKKDHAKVKAELAAIDKKSTFHAEAQQEHDRARDAYISEVEAEAEGLFDQRKCQLIRKLQQDASKQWPEAGERAGEVFDACRKAVPSPPAQQQQQRTTQTTPPPPPPPPPDTGEEDDPEETTGERSNRPFEELLAEAQEAARNNLYGRARRLCSQALEQRRGEPRAVMVCAIAACNLGNARLAKRYYGMAGADQKNQLYQICRSKGIEVRE